MREYTLKYPDCVIAKTAIIAAKSFREVEHHHHCDTRCAGVDREVAARRAVCRTSCLPRSRCTCTDAGTSARIFGYLQNRVPDRVLKRVPGYPLGKLFCGCKYCYIVMIVPSSVGVMVRTISIAMSLFVVCFNRGMSGKFNINLNFIKKNKS